jgi:hypothetical protein
MGIPSFSQSNAILIASFFVRCLVHLLGGRYFPVFSFLNFTEKNGRSARLNTEKGKFFMSLILANDNESELGVTLGVIFAMHKD